MFKYFPVSNTVANLKFVNDRLWNTNMSCRLNTYDGSIDMGIRADIVVVDRKTGKRIVSPTAFIPTECAYLSNNIGCYFGNLCLKSHLEHCREVMTSRIITDLRAVISNKKFKTFLTPLHDKTICTFTHYFGLDIKKYRPYINRFFGLLYDVIMRDVPGEKARAERVKPSGGNSTRACKQIKIASSACLHVPFIGTSLFGFLIRWGIGLQKAHAARQIVSSPYDFRNYDGFATSEKRKELFDKNVSEILEKLDKFINDISDKDINNIIDTFDVKSATSVVKEYIVPIIELSGPENIFNKSTAGNFVRKIVNEGFVKTFDVDTSNEITVGGFDMRCASNNVYGEKYYPNGVINYALNRRYNNESIFAASK